jgi:hypothetical protein
MSRNFEKFHELQSLLLILVFFPFRVCDFEKRAQFPPSSARLRSVNYVRKIDMRFA